MDSTATMLKNKGLKVTPQRIAVFNALASTDKHPTAETLYKAIKETHPYISFATIYKNLETLKNLNLVQEFSVGEDSLRYDATVEAHPHFICSTCNEVLDLPCTLSGKTFVADMVEKSKHKIDKEHFMFFGICENCL
ncbi:MAG: transcriptional repressor [Defluviitaleaceae bacterium]|nr:transcriptional repressor [Defluviitaleaceae bacterium]